MKKLIMICFSLILATSTFAQIYKTSCLVSLPETKNMTVAECSWLPGLIQSKLEANFQDYLGFQIVADSSSEVKIKKLQAQSESDSRNQDDAIEIGKITSAKFALFSQIVKSNKGYSLISSYQDLTTGQKLASVVSKEYSLIDSLYGDTGAVDDITLKLADKLGIEISNLNKTRLSEGSLTFSIDENIQLSKQNQANYEAQKKRWTSELTKLNEINDLSSVLEKNKIEAEIALLDRKQEYEKKRQQELIEQKQKAEEDKSLDLERSIALKNQRDKISKEAAAKASEVRKVKMENQGVLGQINLIETKKRAYIEIREEIENRSFELYKQLLADRKTEEEKIRSKPYGTVELGSDDKPTAQALQRRENLVKASNENLTNKFLAEYDKLKEVSQTELLLTEIRNDQKKLNEKRTVSSMGGEFQVSYGKYEGSKNGWNAYLSLYSEGVELYTDTFVIDYSALSGKKAPDLATASETEFDEYNNTVDMYNSLLLRGDPVLYFEIDYNVTALGDEKPGEYSFNFITLRVINTISGKVVQTNSLNKVISRNMNPKYRYDIREKESLAAYIRSGKEVSNAAQNYISRRIKAQKEAEEARLRLEQAQNEWRKKYQEKVGLILKDIESNMVQIPGRYYSMLKTELTNKDYVYVWEHKYDSWASKRLDLPVEDPDLPVKCRWYNAIYFCNLLSKEAGYECVYSVDGETDVDRWNFDFRNDARITGKITQNLNANGFRLATCDEWQYAAKGGQDFPYSGSKNLKAVAWYKENSKGKLHLVAQKKPNAYGLYDMSGNADEWAWDYSKNWYYRCVGTFVEKRYVDSRIRLGGGYNDYADYLNINKKYSETAFGLNGIRLVRSTETVPESVFIEEERSLIEVEKREEEQRIKEEKAAADNLIFAEKKASELKNRAVTIVKDYIPELEKDMVIIEGKKKKYAVLKTEVTRKLYNLVFGKEKEDTSSDNYPAGIGLYDAVYFCNILSEAAGYEAVYAVNGERDIKKWAYLPEHMGSNGYIYGYTYTGNVTADPNANGFRLPVAEEWLFFAAGGENYKYAGSDNFEEVGWFIENSSSKIHPVGEKKPNGFGLYDMSGNFEEWVFEKDPKDSEQYYQYGGNYYSQGKDSDIKEWKRTSSATSTFTGLRLVRTVR